MAIEKLKPPIVQQLVLKIDGRMANYHWHDVLDVSKMSNLNVDVKNHVISEVMDTVEIGRKWVSHKKSKKFNELIEFWGKIKADYNSKDRNKSNREC